MKYDLVMIEWADSYGVSPSWEEIIPDSEPYPLMVYSAGWLVAKTRKAVTIVPHIHMSDEEVGAVESGCGNMTIPASAIINMTLLAKSTEVPDV